MKIAYVTSVYPSVSQRFIVREVRALRARGVEIGLFSVRRALPSDIVGPGAERDFAETTPLIPLHLGAALGALLWGAATRPMRLTSAFVEAFFAGRFSLTERCRWIAYLVEAVLLARHLARGGFEHLHCHFGNAGSSVAMLAAGLAGIPFSITVHGSELRETRRFRLAAKTHRAAFIACISHYGRAQLMLACPPSDWEKLHIVRCGLSEPVSPGKNAASADLLCVGRLSPEKGHLVFLEALDDLHRRGIDFRCTLVGDGPLRPNIESQLAECGLSERVRLTGSLDPAQVDRQYDAAGAVVLASFSEGVPVVLMEAMARGIPVVATNVGGVGELVQDNVNGLLVPPGDPKALADALARVLQDRSFARALGAKGVERVSGEFDLDRSVDQLQSLFQDAVCGRRPTVAPGKSSVCLPETTTIDS